MNWKRPELINHPRNHIGTAIFLASSDSGCITGQTIIVDGGEVMN
jgi:enoyl-[acyl-carrier-protein] reductase (NADH)